MLFSNENNVQISFPVNIVGSSQFVLIKNRNKWAKRWHDLNLKITNMNIISVVGLFRNCGLDYLLPHYGLMVLGRRVRTGLTATHPKPTCAQTKASSLKPWSHDHSRGNYYKRVMASRCNMSNKKNMLIVSLNTENTKSGYSLSLSLMACT